jgi:4-amino-4-deoxy-L-arabinose transferase-like glycosyltransferase
MRAAAELAPGARPISSEPSKLFWALGLLAFCIWFLTLDARHLLRSDEGRYAQIAYEMFASGDWVTIRYQGLKYFEKPPFHLWMTSLAYSAFGVGEWQARLWVACSGAIGIGITALATKHWFGPRAGGLAALALLAAPTWNIGSHFNSLDMGVSAALACVLCALLIAQHPNNSARQQRLWMWAAWAAMAVAVLSKGLIGILLPGIALVLYTLLTRDWALWTRLCLVSGALLFLLITVPWFWLVQQRNPEFAQFFFIHEHWQRYTSTVHSRSAPAWYFVPQLLAGLLPWLGLVPGLFGLVRGETTHQSQRSFRPLLFCTVWAAGIFVFFSLSGSKLPGYILPMFPALAVLVGVVLNGMDARAFGRQVLGLLLLAVLALLASPLVGRADPNPDVGRYGLWISAACAVAVLGLCAALLVIKKSVNKKTGTTAAIGAYAFTVFAATTVGLLGHEVLGRKASGVDLVPAIQQQLTPEMTLYSVRLLDHTLPFYLRHRVVMVEETDELAFGTQQEPQKWLPKLATFETAWTSGPRAMAVMTPATFAQLQNQQLPMTLVAQDARRVVVANFQGPEK